MHDYLMAKRIQSFGDLREYLGALVLPLLDIEGDLRSLQFISADGSKKFLRGGRIAGCFFTLADKAEGPLALCEGYATGATIHNATGYAVICATTFNQGPKRKRYSSEFMKPFTIPRESPEPSSTAIQFR